MKNPENREFMTKLYRLVERYETAPRVEFADDGAEYFSGVLKECMRIFSEYQNNEFAREFVFAFYTALEERFKRTNPEPLKDRPEQVEMF